jgi:hypothetical protein
MFANRVVPLTLMFEFDFRGRAAGRLVPERKARPQRLKPHAKQCSYRSAEALRYPKSKAISLRVTAAYPFGSL